MLGNDMYSDPVAEFVYLILGGIMIGNHFSGYPSEFVRKTLRESTDPSGISEKATEVFMQIYPK